MANPIFHDPSGRRSRWTASSLAAMVLLVLLTAGLFALTIVNVPTPGPLPLRFDQSGIHALAERIGLARHRKPARDGSWLPAAAALGGRPRRPRIPALYLP